MSEVAQKALDSMSTSITGMSDQIAEYANKTELSEQDMLQFNLLASEYSTMMSLASGLIKTLTDAEQSVAQKM